MLWNDSTTPLTAVQFQKFRTEPGFKIRYHLNTKLAEGTIWKDFRFYIESCKMAATNLSRQMLQIAGIQKSSWIVSKLWLRDRN